MKLQPLLLCSALWAAVISGCTDPDPETLSCEQLRVDWIDFSESNRSCTVDADCINVFNDQLDDFCYIPIGEPQGDLLSVSALADAEPFLQRWEDECHAVVQSEASDAAACYWDYDYYESFSCVAGQCQGILASGGP